MIKFIHTADIHLDSPLKGLEAYEDAPVEEIRGATRRALDLLVDMAVDEKVAFILIAGDLYDGDWKDYHTGLFFTARMGRLSRAGIKVFIVSGNHDAESQIAKTMPLPENVFLFSSQKPQSIKLHDINIVIHGQSYSSRAVTENLASHYPRSDPDFFNIGLLHTSLTGREGHENYAPCTLDDLTSRGYDYWALGHIHKRELVSKDPVILFAGNIQGRHIKETGAKGATLVTVEDDRITDIKEQELDVLRWSICQINLSGCETREDVYENVRSAIKEEQSLADGRTLALRLQLEGSCPVHSELHADAIHITEEIRLIAAGLGNVWLEKVEFRTRRKTNIPEIDGEDGPLSGLLQTLDNIDLGEAGLTTLVPDLASLKTKLPADLFDENSILGNHPEHFRRLKEEVKELLIARLFYHGDET